MLTQRIEHSAVVVTAALASAAAALTVLAPPTALSAQVRTGLTADDGGATLVTAAAGLAGWLVVGWLTVAVAATLAGRLPGLLGRAGRGVAGKVTPAVVRRAVGGGAAVGLALAPVVLPVAAHAATCAAAPTAVTAPYAAGGASLSVFPSLDRPSVGCPPAAPPPAVSSPAASSSTAPTAAASVVATPVGSRHRDDGPATGPRTSVTDTAGTAVTGTAGTGTAGTGATQPAGYVVRPGDTLWGLARTELTRAGATATPAAVAARWPAWWQANRDVLGADPDLLHPGTALTPPTR